MGGESKLRCPLLATTHVQCQTDLGEVLEVEQLTQALAQLRSGHFLVGLELHPPGWQLRGGAGEGRGGAGEGRGGEGRGGEFAILEGKV